MRYRTLGTTDLIASEIGLGCWAIGGRSWGPVDDVTSVAAIRRAIDVGINFFDTSDSYGNGHSETLLGSSLVDARDRTIICSKGGILPELSGQDFSANYLGRAVEGSLQRLRRDAIDLYLLHNPDRVTIERGEAFETMERLRSAGMVRHWGVSVRPAADQWKAPPSGSTPSPIDDALATLSLTKPAAIEIVFNMFEAEAAAKLFAEAHKRGVGIIGRVPLASGLLSGKFASQMQFPRGDFRRTWPREQFEADLQRLQRLMARPAMRGRALPEAALAFALSFDELSVIIPGAKTPQQVEQNAAASNARRFDRAQLAEIIAST
jgi:aryl-alcohol dehydrogenase-like predicted oxidoreductase